MWAIDEEVLDGNREVVIGIEQAGGRGDDPVTIGVGVVAEGDAVIVLEGDELGHGVRAGAVHADLAIVIEGHEGEGGVDGFVDDGDVEVVALANGVPIGEACAAEGIDADL